MKPTPKLSLADLAYEEFATRRANFRSGLRAGRVPRDEAEAVMLRWAAIARYFGAQLPAELCDHDGAQMAWIEFYPPGERVDLLMSAMGTELRRAAEAAIRHYQENPHKAALRTRVTALIKLDSHLYYRAGLPALQITGPLTPELDGPERRAA